MVMWVYTHRKVNMNNLRKRDRLRHKVSNRKGTGTLQGYSFPRTVTGWE